MMALEPTKAGTQCQLPILTSLPCLVSVLEDMLLENIPKRKAEKEGIPLLEHQKTACPSIRRQKIHFSRQRSLSISGIRYLLWLGWKKTMKQITMHRSSFAPIAMTLLLLAQLLLHQVCTAKAAAVAKDPPSPPSTTKPPPPPPPPLPRGRKSIADMRCDFLTQPLNHFHIPIEESPVYRQRYCIYDGYVQERTTTTQQQRHNHSTTAPIFFYTGNESPLEQYINHTGLMWELAPEFGAEIIFVEHRYEGQSKPAPNISHCLAYSSSKQALEDYARFLEWYLLGASSSSPTTIAATRPVVAFGGSYGGMLSAWMRIKYPHLITAGAVAASAPIAALPRALPPQEHRIDGAFRILYRSLQLPYPPTTVVAIVKDEEEEPVESAHAPESAATLGNKKKHTATENHCARNLLATWPLLHYLSRHPAARTQLVEWFRLCPRHPNPLPRATDVTTTLTEWIRTPWFDLAEGSFPYPSSYIPAALTHHVVNLPPWPLQAACWKNSSLHQDWGIVLQGNLSNVHYNISYPYGDNNNNNNTTSDALVLHVDWDQMTAAPHHNVTRVLQSPQVAGLLTSVRDAVAVWYNMTLQEPCFNLTPAINTNVENTGIHRNSRRRRRRLLWQRQYDSLPRESTDDATDQEEQVVPVQGDHPSLLRGFDSSAKMSFSSRVTDFLFGYDTNHYNHSSKKKKPKNATAECEARIARGSWDLLCCNENMNLIVYEAQGMGNDHLWPPSYPRGTTTHAQVIRHNPFLRNQSVPDYCLDPDGFFGFSQLPVDPWSTRMDTYYGGTRSISKAHSNIVFSNGLLDPWTAGGVNVPWEDFITDPGSYKGRTVIPMGDESQDMVALMIEFGGHHTDLMYSHEKDPISVTQARTIEKEYIARWIQKFYETH